MRLDLKINFLQIVFFFDRIVDNDKLERLVISLIVILLFVKNFFKLPKFGHPCWTCYTSQAPDVGKRRAQIQNASQAS